MEEQILTTSSSGRRSGDSNSPEFEFWMIRNPSFPQPDLLSADELFSGGVLLPLDHLHLSNDIPTSSGSDPSPAIESGQLSVLTSSKRWTDIFRRNDMKDTDGAKLKHIKDRKREKKMNGARDAAELNINIWPFSRSRSAGNGGTRPRSLPAARKVSSAPCSRSNSAGESKSRKWPSSPSRGGVHLGRTSPVWQLRRSSARIPEQHGKKENTEARRKVTVAGGGSKSRVLNLNVPMCIGYRHNLRCRSGDHSVTSTAAVDPSGEVVRGSSLFNIRSLFTKKVY